MRSFTRCVIGVVGAFALAAGAAAQSYPAGPIRDFAPVSLLSLAPNVLVAHPSVPAKSVKALIALARAKPGEVAHASSASGSTREAFAAHLKAEFAKWAKVIRQSGAKVD